MAIIWIRLTPDEIRWAGIVAVERRLHGTNRKLVEHYGVPEWIWDSEMIGTMTETAMCRYMGKTWGKGLVIGAPDCGLVAPLGPRIQVRGTRHQDGMLLLHNDPRNKDGSPKDADEDWFILALVKGVFDVGLAGYIRGRDGKKDDYWRTKKTTPALSRPCFGVLQKDLRELPAVPRQFGTDAA
jgi:hypothetical protein